MRLQRGAAVVESAICMILVLLLGLAAAQWALIYHAKVLLDHAALQGARAGAVRNADPEAISAGLARALLPLYLPEASVESADGALHERVIPDLQDFATLRILNPTREAFADFGRQDGQAQYIPNTSLSARSSSPGNASRLSIQDANLLKIEIAYGYRLAVPLAGRLMTAGLRLPFVGNLMAPGDQYSDAQLEWLENGRLPIVASATVRMQSRAYMNERIRSGK